LHKFEINYRLFELNSGGVAWGRGCGTAKPPFSASTPPLLCQHVVLRPESMSDVPLYH